MLDLLLILENIEGAKIKWYYLEEDYDMEEAGEEFAEIIDVPFEFIEIEDEWRNIKSVNPVICHHN